MINARSNTDWFKAAGWGVFCHYLFDTLIDRDSPDFHVEEWNRYVDSFDVDKLALQLKSVGAKFMMITVGQNSGYYCSPNSTYDSITGNNPCKCSKRDLVYDLAVALEREEIRLMVYTASGAPTFDRNAMEKLEWQWGFEGDWGAEGGCGDPAHRRTGKRLAEFQLKWEAVIREWSLRWGSKVSGWWIDGCYFADEMYRHPEAPNFESFAAALRAGNPDSIIAFNGGLFAPVITMTEHEDYTAGEIAEVFPVCSGRWVNGKQYHILSYLGKDWGDHEPRFCTEFAVGYTKDVVQKGGVVTWDVPIQKDGIIPQRFMEQLGEIGRAVRCLII